VSDEFVLKAVRIAFCSGFARLSGNGWAEYFTTPRGP
jgi:hypothetical protein